MNSKRCTVRIVSLILIGGCQSEPEPLPDVTVDIPAEFKVGGITWKKQESLQKSDEDCLSRFFTQNQGLVGSAEFEGQPTLFSSGKSDRQFFWTLSSADGVSNSKTESFQCPTVPETHLSEQE